MASFSPPVKTEMAWGRDGMMDRQPSNETYRRRSPGKKTKTDFLNISLHESPSLHCLSPIIGRSTKSLISRHSLKDQKSPATIPLFPNLSESRQFHEIEDISLRPEFRHCCNTVDVPVTSPQSSVSLTGFGKSFYLERVLRLSINFIRFCSPHEGRSL